jgi:replicative DNA helicase
LSVDTFYLPDSKRAFEACSRLHAAKTKIDLTTLDAAIESAFGADSVNGSFLIECLRSTPSSANARAYAKIVREAASRRRIYELCNRVCKDIQDPTNDLHAITEEARSKLSTVITRPSSWESMADVLLASYEDIENRAKGAIKPIVSGIESLDKLTGGFYPGELTVVGAPPAVGKSAFALQLAITGALLSARHIAFSSSEMVNVQLGMRLLANASKIKGQRLRTAEIKDEDWVKLSGALQDYSQLPISFLFSTRCIEDICAEATQMKAEKRCDMLIVDYLQLLSTRKRFERDYLRVGYISERLKNLTTDLNIPVIALAQVSRQSSGRCPVLSDLRDSGEIEQDADNVIFLHRPESAADPFVCDEHKSMFNTFLDGVNRQYIVMNVAKQTSGANRGSAPPCLRQPR